MTREDFIFTIGFDGNDGVVDKKFKKMYGKLNSEELLKRGFLKPAVCSALYSGDEEEKKMVLKRYNELSGSDFASFKDLENVFGLLELSEDNSAFLGKTISI